MRKWGKDRRNKEKWYESGDPERGIAGRKKGMMMTRESETERRNEGEKQVGLDRRALEEWIGGWMDGVCHKP